MHAPIRSARRLVALAGTVLLGGCAVGPDYVRPDAPVPEQYLETGQGGQPSPAALAGWWRTLGDEQLTSLVDRAIDGNQDLRRAAARLAQARALRAVAAADLFPSVDAAARYDWSEDSRAIDDFPAETGPGELFNAGFDATWEIDVWGRVRRSVEAADADLDAAQEDLRDVLVTLVAEVARTYVELRSAQVRLGLAEGNAALQQDAVRLAEARLSAGLASELDVTRARAQLETTRAALPALDAAARASIHRLAVLVGEPPVRLADELTSSAPIPAAAPDVPLGLPSDLLQRRADIRRAERELAASTARIGVATGDLFPRFSLTGTFGVESSELDRFGDSDTSFWSIGPAVRWRIFDAGRIASNIRAQEARTEEAVAAYRQSVLLALEEVENALIRYAREQVRERRLADAAAANRRSVDLATELYTRGLSDFNAVIDAQRELLDSEDALAVSAARVRTELVALYKALGGGWDEPGLADRPIAGTAPPETPPIRFGSGRTDGNGG